jgi:hypothetical protein
MRGVVISDNPPNNIDYFLVNNQNEINVDGIPFDYQSFQRPNGQIASQCECVIYPHISNSDSWICFVELKYSNIPENNRRNLNKARLQLFKTQYYYKSKKVFNSTNTCYLLASLPMQSPPFINFELNPVYLANMKRRHNIIIGCKNCVEIVSDTILSI